MLLIQLNKNITLQTPLEPETVKLELPADYEPSVLGAEEAYLKTHVITSLKFVRKMYNLKRML